jgi:hypothetical protein
MLWDPGQIMLEKEAASLSVQWETGILLLIRVVRKTGRRLAGPLSSSLSLKAISFASLSASESSSVQEPL